jgi:hypothetical protein
MKSRGALLRTFKIVGAATGYGCLAAFLALIGVQVYRWFRDGEWTHIGMLDGMRTGLNYCCVRDGATGRVLAWQQWMDSPVDWLGVHRVFEVVPASLALFLMSILGNCLYIYCRDRLPR